MRRPYLTLILLVLSALLAGCAGKAVAQSNEVMSADSAATELVAHDPSDTCPITRAPEIPFTPPTPYLSKPPERYINQFWYGTPALWTMLGIGGDIWNDLPHNRDGYTQKVFWWSQDFNKEANPYPAFTVTAEQLDVPSSPLVLSERATNASADFGVAMLTGVSIPTSGCWKITGNYEDTILSFVVWVAP